MRIVNFLASAAALGAAAAPAAAQYYPQQQTYPQQYQQTYPQYQQGYGQPAYGYGQSTTGNPVTDIIDQLLGGNNSRYSVTDRQAVRQCARAAQVQAQSRYGGYGGYGNRDNDRDERGYGQQIAAPSMRVTSITGVQRRGNGVRVSGMMSSGYAGQYGQYGNGYQNQAYAGAGDISFRCDVAYNGQVTNIRIGGGYRRY